MAGEQCSFGPLMRPLSMLPGGYLGMVRSRCTAHLMQILGKKNSSYDSSATTAAAQRSTPQIFMDDAVTSYSPIVTCAHGTTRHHSVPLPKCHAVLTAM
jgi:hypothetical protein